MGGASPPAGKALDILELRRPGDAGETSEGPATGPSRAGPGPADTSVSECGAYPAPRGERVASSSARRASAAQQCPQRHRQPPEHPAAGRRTLRARHQRPARRPGGHRPVRRARAWSCPSSSSPSWRPSGTIPSWATSPARRCGSSTTCGSSTAGSTPTSRSATLGGTLRVELNHTDPAVLPAGFRLGDNDTRILSVARSLAAEGDDVVLVSKDLPLRVKAAVGRPDRRGVPRRARRRLRLDRDGRARRQPRRRSTSCTRPATLDLRGGPRPALPHRARAARPASGGSALGRVHAGQVGAAGPRRPGGVRPARPQRRAAGRARPAARPGDRHRLARRPGRHRQVRAGAVRRARGGAGAAPAPQGGRVPAAVRGRRPGARLPARARRPRR